jgi:hypothetical protein
MSRYIYVSVGVIVAFVWTEETHDELQQTLSIARLKFKPGTTEYKAKSFTATPNSFINEFLCHSKSIAYKLHQSYFSRLPPLRVHDALKVKLSLCSKHHAMKAYWGVKV